MQQRRALKIRYTPKIGDIYSVRFEGHGCEQAGVRPAMIFSNNIGNIYSPNVTVLPITSKLKKTDQPTHVVVSASDTGLITDSMILCENPVCISKDRLGMYLTKTPMNYMSEIAEASILASGGIAFIDPSKLEYLWSRAAAMNSI